MDSLKVLPKTETIKIANGLSATNQPPVQTESVRTPLLHKEGIKKYLDDSSWLGTIRNWFVGLVVLVWGGQGIYDRNFNQKEDSQPAIQKLEEENTNQRKKVEALEKEIKKLKEGKEKK